VFKELGNVVNTFALAWSTVAAASLTAAMVAGLLLMKHSKRRG
jgi:hypothetical protein